MSAEQNWDVTQSDLVIERLINAAANRDESYGVFSARDLAEAAERGSPQVRLAVGLYQAQVALQQLDRNAAAEAMRQVKSHLAADTPLRLQWWFYHTRAEIEGAHGDHRACFKGFKHAIAIARDGYGLEIESERSAASLLIGLCREGQGQAVATTLVRYLHDKRTNALGPYFYQIVSDTLRWLGHFEVAYQFRVRSMEIVSPQGAILDRDRRELARTLIALHRLDDARTHLDRDRASTREPTTEEAIDRCNVVAEWCAAAGDLDGAMASLAEARTLSPVTDSWARALLAVAEMLLERGEFAALGATLDSLESPDLERDLRPRLYVLQAELAAQRGDINRAATMFDAAAKLAKQRVPRAETQAEILSELGPWLSVATPGSVAHSMIEARRVYRSRWLRATAGDIRRSLAPAVLVADADVSDCVVTDVLRSAIDELVLVAEFLFDAGGYFDPRPMFHSSRMITVVKRIATRRGVHLVIPSRPNDEFEPTANGPVERFVFGLVALITDHATAGTTVTVEFGPETAQIHTTDLDQDAVAAVLIDLQQLLINSLHQDRRMPHRASFLATLDALTALGWSVSFTNPGPEMLEIKMAGPPRATSKERLNELNPSNPIGRAVPEVVVPWPDGTIGRALRRQHDARIEGVGVDHRLLAHARANANIDLQGCGLLVNALAAFQARDLALAATLVAELRRLFATDPGLEARVKPGAVYLYNLESQLASWSGDYRSKWIATACGVLTQAPIDDTSPTFAHVMYNWSQAEVCRGELASAWHSAGMCDSTATSVAGRCLLLGVRTTVLLAEGHLDEAVRVASERFELARRTEVIQRQESLVHLALAWGRKGCFHEAMRTIEKLSASRALSPPGEIDAVQGVALFHSGQRQAAKEACLRAEAQVIPGYSSRILSIAAPVHAEVLLDEGQPELARQVLDGQPIDQQRYFCLHERLRVERLVAEALGDDDALLDALRGEVRWARREPRFDARTLPIYAELRDCLDECALRDRQRVDEEQSAVASVVAHDLRNALSAASLALDLIEHFPAEWTRTRIASALQPIEHLAEQLDSVAQWDGAPHVVKAQVFDIVELLDAVICPAAASMESTGGQLLVDWDLPDRTEVRIHAHMLLTVLSNLVGNAVKYGQRGGTVKVSAQYSEGSALDAYRPAVVVTIEDDGPGLPPIQVARLDPSSPQTTASGGLGLWIVRRYSGALGVEIGVGSSRLGGARITAAIPIGDLSDGDEVADTAPLLGGDAAFEAPRDAPRRILVVEDDERLSSLINEVLVSKAKEVLSAPTAADALQLLEQSQIDLILADVELADGSTGFDVINGAHLRGFNPQIVVMSGQSAEQIRAQCGERIESDFKVLQKPYTLSALIEVVG